MSIHEKRVQKANRAIKEIKDQVKSTKHRQKYHFMAPANWLNDPNGLVMHDGLYHLFYQHNPYNSKWGAMHWGHAVSKDFCSWEHLPIALAPSEPYDDHPEGGCFSGSAIVKDNKMYLFYTGTTQQNGKYVQTQCVAISDDFVHFEKYEKNPIIINDIEEVDPADYRDPKVWYEEERNEYYMVVGASISGRGNAVLYKSRDLFNWETVGKLVDYDEDFGTMWECPDFFRIGDKYVLLFSPMELGEKTTIYMTGEMDFNTGKFQYEYVGRIDYGFDYYAPQTLLDDKGRRLMIAWQNGWDWMPWWKGFGPTSEDNWCGSMSLPRVVNLNENGSLSFKPIELKSNQGKELYNINDQKNGVNQSIIVEDLPPNFEALLSFSSLKSSVEIEIENESGRKLTLTLEENRLIFDGSQADSHSPGKCEMPLLTEVENGVRIFFDTSSMEIFDLNESSVLSSNIYLENCKRKITVHYGEQAELKSFIIKEIIL